MKYVLLLFFFILVVDCHSQHLKLKKRAANALSGSEFSKSIRDSSLSLEKREEIIFNEIQSGNIPRFYRKLALVRDTAMIMGQLQTIRYYGLPDFLAIGSDSDYFYCPMRPQLAQKIADLLGCSLPTRKISDRIYHTAKVKMMPQPIPPSKAMITVPVFERHTRMVQQQREQSIRQYSLGSLVDGNKKDVVISNKIFNDRKQLRVVIYGWHKPDGKAIQPLHNGHTTDHVDYSHGIRLIQNKLWINGKKSTLRAVLGSETLHPLLSDEGVIKKAYYPVE
ncbi:MAG: hypothetical protein B7X86_01835 [Sphingobacteriales bacterium 17-39-43]|uniref:hypothetical protein n=1 Tax=Daejeonella sp. TaxID=2805397 RepID=UPI000BC8C82A|nr:hypothetical protein [Daejeonella sp.]OYZ33096.1 MAG: hypothetical protein B7Y24_01840 [Sphingobacteriales bacterium 16-39-50]OZA26505.1 MAG: hypothetical protein B7X86_01835 [Sphingobacteriales bacterium 17-39-43]OZA60602.1 MAG: hypothetical protein B7X75_03350 [Sphingobacteriales bacterium 39-40-5]HQS51373.1 hypothetical protein [Daejeonella sp.]HQT21650.1 hypothetical protein [Daejeonella sp.]